MTALDSTQLERITGGVAPTGAAAAPANDNAFGRCGPGTAWQFLGNVYTPECACHDAAVRNAEASGTPHWLAHVEALPELPAAVGSYLAARLAG